MSQKWLNLTLIGAWIYSITGYLHARSRPGIPARSSLLSKKTSYHRTARPQHQTGQTWKQPPLTLAFRKPLSIISPPTWPKQTKTRTRSSTAGKVVLHFWRTFDFDYTTRVSKSSNSPDRSGEALVKIEGENGQETCREGQTSQKRILKHSKAMILLSPPILFLPKIHKIQTFINPPTTSDTSKPSILKTCYFDVIFSLKCGAV